MELLDSMADPRLSSHSFLLSISVDDYLTLVSEPYDKQGGLAGQRGAMTTTTAIRIRDRMADDIRRGAILPPLVLGVTADPKQVSEAATWDVAALQGFISKRGSNGIVIIDGMQRTTALRENQSRIAGRTIRVELWIVPQSSALTYRMLVLNTGQVPWNLRRQLEVLNRTVLEELLETIRVRRSTDQSLPDVEIFSIDDRRRRIKAAQYQANEVIEMYLAYGMRKHVVDKESALADQFARLDMVEAVSKDSFLGEFVTVLLSMATLDVSLERVEPVAQDGRFSGGRSVFDSQPACVAWAVASAQLAYGRPGTERSREQATAAIGRIVARANEIRDILDGLSGDDLIRFTDLATLNEVVGQQAGKIGDFERALFLDAFRVLLSEPEAPSSLTSCWRAH